MCFSAPASFTAAAVAGIAGLAAVARVPERRQLPIAAMPLFFAGQQVLEGLLWLNLPHAPQAPEATLLIQTFLFFALIFWPLYAPLAALSLETVPKRRLLIGLCAIAGVAVAAYFMISLAQSPRTAVIAGGHIVYSADPALPAAMLVLYPVATCLALLLSSHRYVALLGGIVFIGSMVAYFVYWNAFTSVWCFFAAAASGVIVLMFEVQRRHAAARDTARI